MRTERIARSRMTTGQGARHVGSSLAPATEKFLSAGALRASSLPARPVPTEKSATLSRISGGKSIRQTLSGESGTVILQTPSAESTLAQIAARFPLPWLAYVRLLAVKNEHARSFYETEALRAGWSVRQLDRQIQSQFYERTALSRNKAAMLAKGARPQPGDVMSPDEEVKDPYVLEFLGVRDEYSETDLEAALIQHLETFLLELGGDFCFIGRQRRLRIGDQWYRVDLLFYHRRLRCLVLIDLKLGRFTHADAGQMHTYLGYAAGHWTRPDENPPVGLILCAEKDEALARYALGKQVETRTGLSRSTIYQYIKDGVFPKPVPLGPRAVGWLESDVSEWIAARVKIAREGGRQSV